MQNFRDVIDPRSHITDQHWRTQPIMKNWAVHRAFDKVDWRSDNAIIVHLRQLEKK